jgi:hypothetical protein
MKKVIQNLLLALPLLFAVNFATPTKAEARSLIYRPGVIIVAPRYEYRPVLVYGTYYANYGGYLVLVTGYYYQWQLVLVY